MIDYRAMYNNMLLIKWHGTSSICFFALWLWTAAGGHRPGCLLIQLSTRTGVVLPVISQGHAYWLNQSQWNPTIGRSSQSPMGFHILLEVEATHVWKVIRANLCSSLKSIQHVYCIILTQTYLVFVLRDFVFWNMSTSTDNSGTEMSPSIDFHMCLLTWLGVGLGSGGRVAWIPMTI